MREIVRRSANSAPISPALLSGTRPTQLAAGGDFFACRILSAEYDLRDRERVGHAQLGRDAAQKFTDNWLVKVGEGATPRPTD